MASFGERLHAGLASKNLASFGASLHSGYNHPATRSWQSTNTEITSKNLIYPLFISFGINNIEKVVSPLVEKGLKSVLLFGVLAKEDKSDDGYVADSDVSPVILATKKLHCILNKDGSINNEASLKRLAEISLAFAEAGCQVIAPSDMMDNRVAAIKSLLHKKGFGGKERDVKEGADMVMVKPGMAYLDIVRQTKDKVSGEFAMLYHGSKAGAFDLKTIVLECLTSMRRAEKASMRSQSDQASDEGVRDLLT